MCPDTAWTWLTRIGKAFEVLLDLMKREYNPAAEKKKAGWFSWGR